MKLIRHTSHAVARRNVVRSAPVVRPSEHKIRRRRFNLRRPRDASRTVLPIDRPTDR